MAKNNFNIQVLKKHYYNKYDTIDRFISYYYQTSLTKELNPRSILEIGIGNKTVANYLKQHGYHITTVDFDEELQPDYVADIRKLPFDNNSFDTILAFEILEHLPWEDVDKALSELHRLTSKYVIISIPCSSAIFEIIVQFPLIKRIFRKSFIELFFLRIPYFFRDIKFKGDHYWEMGRKRYSIRKVRKLLRTKFIIIKEVRPILDTIHYFFVLEKI